MMIRWIFTALAALALIGIQTQAIPFTVRLQTEVIDTSTNEALNGQFTNVVVSIIELDTNGTQVLPARYTTTLSNVNFTNGFADLVLGVSPAFSSDTFDVDNFEIQMVINTGSALQTVEIPAVNFSVPSAINAQFASQVPTLNLDITTLVGGTNVIQPDMLASGIPIAKINGAITPGTITSADLVGSFPNITEVGVLTGNLLVESDVEITGNLTLNQVTTQTASNQNQLLIRNTTTNIVELVDASNWDQDQSDDVQSASDLSDFPSFSVTEAGYLFRVDATGSAIELIPAVSAGTNASLIQGASVATTTPLSDQLLQFDGTSWTPVTLNQLLDTDLQALSDIDIDPSQASNNSYMLVVSGNQWVAAPTSDILEKLVISQSGFSLDSSNNIIGTQENIVVGSTTLVNGFGITVTENNSSLLLTGTGSRGLGATIGFGNDTISTSTSSPRGTFITHDSTGLRVESTGNIYIGQHADNIFIGDSAQLANPSTIFIGDNINFDDDIRIFGATFNVQASSVFSNDVTINSNLAVRGNINMDAGQGIFRNGSQVVQLFDESDAYALGIHATAEQSGVLALRSQQTAIQDQAFLGFYNNDDALIGSISGHEHTTAGISGVKIESAGADYAEYLERENKNETMEAADIVGVFEGKISKRTENAQHVMVISSMPIVLGNWKGQDTRSQYEAVAFVGQVPVKVRGKVRAGDFIIPSGKNDGVGVAVSPSDITLTQAKQIAGQAWESSTSTGLKTINLAVLPLGHSKALTNSYANELEQIKQQLAELKDTLSND